MNGLVVRVSADAALFKFGQGHSVLVKVLFGSKGRFFYVDDFIVGGFDTSLIAVNVSGLRQNVSKLIITLSCQRLQLDISNIIQNNGMVYQLVQSPPIKFPFQCDESILLQVLIVGDSVECLIAMSVPILSVPSWNVEHLKRDLVFGDSGEQVLDADSGQCVVCYECGCVLDLNFEHECIFHS